MLSQRTIPFQMWITEMVGPGSGKHVICLQQTNICMQQAKFDLNLNFDIVSMDSGSLKSHKQRMLE